MDHMIYIPLYSALCHPGEADFSISCEPSGKMNTVDSCHYWEPYKSGRLGAAHSLACWNVLSEETRDFSPIRGSEAFYN